eukprot:1419258-Prymnesium_polylepis.1
MRAQRDTLGCFTFWTGFALRLPCLILVGSRRAAHACGTARIRSVEAIGTWFRRGASGVTTRPRRTQLALVRTREVAPCPHRSRGAEKRCWACEWTVTSKVTRFRNAGCHGTKYAFWTKVRALRTRLIAVALCRTNDPRRTRERIIGVDTCKLSPIAAVGDVD